MSTSHARLLRELDAVIPVTAAREIVDANESGSLRLEVVEEAGRFRLKTQGSAPDRSSPNVTSVPRVGAG
jgi:hypothetical protein